MLGSVVQVHLSLPRNNYHKCYSKLTFTKKNKYIAVGIITVVLDIILMTILISLSVNAIVASTISFYIAVLINYYLQSVFTFETVLSTISLTRYLTVLLLNYFITTLLVYIFIQFLLNPIIGKLLSIPLVVINSYYLSMHWIYKK